MRPSKYLIVLGVFLSGCAAPISLIPTPITFSNANMTLTVVQTGCGVRTGEYRDLSGKGNSFPYLRFVAIDKAKNTVGEWRASCHAVVANGISQCSISGGITVSYTDLGGPGCPDLQNFDFKSMR